MNNDGMFTPKGLDGKYLTFSSADQHYAFSIVNVIEIIEIPAFTTVPESQEYFKGIINLRGRIIPLVDVRLRFGKPEIEYTSRTCVIVVDIGGMEIGFIVDAVEAVIDIVESQISPPPSITLDRSGRYVMGIARVDDRIILLLDQNRMFSKDEVDSMKKAL